MCTSSRSFRSERLCAAGPGDGEKNKKEGGQNKKKGQVKREEGRDGGREGRNTRGRKG